MNEENEKDSGENGQERYKSIPFRLLARFFPGLLFRLEAHFQGIDSSVYDRLHEGFSKSDRIDIFPTFHGRGFIIVVDGKTSLHFYQDGDHFVYDGFELGKYEKGDVTIFDNLPVE